ncbi:MAG: hypothetical protein UH239_01880 [Acutalibacteraceae bacterium]|nr:hypothetical protein [Acutalibacteraceae bacterium]
MNNPMDISKLYGLNNTDKSPNNPAKYISPENYVKNTNNTSIKNNTENINQNNNDPNASAVIKMLSNNRTMIDSENSETENTTQKSCCSKQNLVAVPYPLRNQADGVIYHNPDSPYPSQSRNRERLIKTNATDINSEYSNTNISNTSQMPNNNNMQITVPWKNNMDINIMKQATKTSDTSDIRNIPTMDDSVNMTNIMDMSNTTNMATTENSFPQQYRVTPQNMQCMNGFLRSQTGKIAEVEFIVDGITKIKQGYLTAIGDNYILITEIDTGKLIVCDHADLKFVTLYN